MGTPTLKVRVAFDVGPLEVPEVWTDVSQWARRVTIDRGRDHELSRSQAGQATVVLSNMDRRFDPTNGSSPYFPNVIPMRQIAVSAAWGTAHAYDSADVYDSAISYEGNEYPLFTGYIEDWGQEWLPRPIKASGDAEAVLRCVDGFKVLSLFEMAGSGIYRPLVLATPGLIDYWPLEEAAGSATVDDIGTGNNDLTVNGAQVTLGVTPSALSGPAGAADILGVGNTPLRDASATGFWADENSMAVYSVACDFWIKVDSYPVGDSAGIVSVTGSSGGNGILAVQLGSTGRIIVGWREHASGFPGQERNTASDASVPLGVWTHVGISRAGTACYYYINGVLDVISDFTGAGPYGSIASGQTPTIVVGAIEDEPAAPFLDAKLAHVAVYYGIVGPSFMASHAGATLQGSGTADTTGAQIGFLLDAIGWPASRRVLDVGDSDMSDISVSGSILESILTLGEDSEQGLVQMDNTGKVLFHSRSAVLGHSTAEATFADDGTGVKYADLQLRYNDQDLYTQVIAQAIFAGATEQTAIGATVAQFGPRVLRKSGLHLATDTEAANFAGFLAQRYDEPEVRVLSVSLPMVADANWPAILGIDTHHAKVAISRTPPGGGSAITKNAHVEGVHWNINPAEGVWQPAFNLVPAFEEEFWIMGTSAFDDETIFAW